MGLTPFLELPLPEAIKKANEQHARRNRAASDVVINIDATSESKSRDEEIEEYKKFSKELTNCLENNKIEIKIDQHLAKNTRHTVYLPTSSGFQRNPQEIMQGISSSPKELHSPVIKQEINRSITISSDKMYPENSRGCVMSGSRKLTDREIIQRNYKLNSDYENLSVINFRLLYWFLLFSGCYAPHSGSFSLRYVYPLLITSNIIYSIYYHFIEVETPYLPVYFNIGLVFLTSSLLIFWLGRKHLMNSWFNCNPNVNYMMTQYALYFHNKKKRADKLAKEVNLVLLLALFIWMAFFSYQTFDYSKLVNLDTDDKITRFVFFRIGWFYYYLIMTSFFSYCYFVFVIHDLELKSIHNRIKYNNYENSIELIQHHRIINRRMQKTSSQIGILLFIGISMIMIRVPIALYIYNKVKDLIQILFIAVCFAIFFIYISKIASINYRSDTIIPRMYDYQIFKNDYIIQIEKYIKQNPAHFKIAGLAITYSILTTVSFPLVNLVFPILFTWIGFGD
jgi:hypothetical protein